MISGLKSTGKTRYDKRITQKVLGKQDITYEKAESISHSTLDTRTSMEGIKIKFG